MPAIDPFPYNIDSLGPPYCNAFSIDMAALLEGAVELPAVSSAIYVVGGGKLRVTLVSGTALELPLESPGLILPIRAVAIGAYLPDADDWRPNAIVALW